MFLDEALKLDFLVATSGELVTNGLGVVAKLAVNLPIEMIPSLFVSRCLARLSIEYWSIMLRLNMALLKLQMSICSDLSGLSLTSSSLNSAVEILRYSSLTLMS